jgi:7,8-dihydroneopterin aldolase/epimerase/oxygenase
MTRAINIEGIHLYAYHGCLDEEARIGQKYVVDVYIRCDFSQAAKTDDLSKTVDYCTVYEICKAEMAIRSKLIEQVCERIYNSLYTKLDGIQQLHVRLTKLHPPIKGDVEKVSVEIKD